MDKFLIEVPFSGFYETLLGELLPYDLSDEDKQAFINDLGKDYISSLNRWIYDEIGIKLFLEFKEVISPKEYNFTTDRLLAAINYSELTILHDIAFKERLHGFSEYLKDRFTSYDGFYSYYPSDVRSWIDHSLREWDHNQTGALLDFLVSKELNTDTHDLALIFHEYYDLQNYYIQEEAY